MLGALLKLGVLSSSFNMSLPSAISPLFCFFRLHGLRDSFEHLGWLSTLWLVCKYATVIYEAIAVFNCLQRSVAYPIHEEFLFGFSLASKTLHHTVTRFTF